jgi:hypothetical protein
MGFSDTETKAGSDVKDQNHTGPPQSLSSSSLSLSHGISLHAEAKTYLYSWACHICSPGHLSLICAKHEAGSAIEHVLPSLSLTQGRERVV